MEPAAEVFRLAKRRCVEERVHFHGDVANRRVAEERRRDQHAEHPDHHRDAGQPYRRIHVDDVAVGGGMEHHEREAAEYAGVDPGGRAAQPVFDLVAEDFAKLHDAARDSPLTTRRPWCPAITLK